MEIEEVENIIDIMKNRGYYIHSYNPNNKYFIYTNSDNGLSCEVIVKDYKEVVFKISKMIGMIICTTPECGSLDNEDHFKKFEKWVEQIVKKEE